MYDFKFLHYIVSIVELNSDVKLRVSRSFIVGKMQVNGGTRSSRLVLVNHGEVLLGVDVYPGLLLATMGCDKPISFL